MAHRLRVLYRLAIAISATGRGFTANITKRSLNSMYDRHKRYHLDSESGLVIDYVLRPNGSLAMRD